MPKTIQGKNRSRMNALKHGLRATDELFLTHLRPPERAVLQSIRDVLYREYAPATDHEKLLVDRIAIQHFRLYRLYRLEYHATNRSVRAPLSPESILPHLDRFSRYDCRIERQLRVLVNRLRSSVIARGADPSKLPVFKE